MLKSHIHNIINPDIHVWTPQNTWNLKKPINLSKKHKRVAERALVILENAKNGCTEDRTCQPGSMMEAIADGIWMREREREREREESVVESDA